uniref:Aquaporin n=1 Tax=Biomphalaria glabrata TaxID=6526 RepID=A0A2C9K455_BIOGL
MVALGAIFGLEEVMQVRVLKMAAAELCGAAILVLIGCGSVGTLSPGASPPTMSVGLAFGLALALAIWVFGHTSGAHVNPAVTIGFLVTGHMGVLKSALYIVFQLLGAIIGAGILCLSIPEPWRGGLGSTTLAEGVEQWQGFLIEMVTTFLLVLTVMASSDRLRTDHSGSTALSIGLCVTANIAWSGTVTGGSMNPARSLGPAVWSGIWANHWIYWVAPSVGAIAAALLYQHVFSVKTQESDSGLRFTDTPAGKRDNFLEYAIDIDSPGGSRRVESPLPHPKLSFLMGKFGRQNSRNIVRINSVQSNGPDSGSNMNDDSSEAGSTRGLTTMSNEWGVDKRFTITKM